LPTVDCSPAGAKSRAPSAVLVEAGASIPVVIRSILQFGDQCSVDALIDTGSELTILNETLVSGWQFLVVDRLPLGGTATASANICVVELEIPWLNSREIVEIAVAPLIGRGAIFGRNQLRTLNLNYDGRTGRVLLTR
jgi:predicted aspartyl protease